MSSPFSYILKLPGECLLPLCLHGSKALAEDTTSSSQVCPSDTARASGSGDGSSVLAPRLLFLHHFAPLPSGDPPTRGHLRWPGHYALPTADWHLALSPFDSSSCCHSWASTPCGEESSPELPHLLYSNHCSLHLASFLATFTTFCVWPSWTFRFFRGTILSLTAMKHQLNDNLLCHILKVRFQEVEVRGMNILYARLFVWPKKNINTCCPNSGRR